MQWWKVDKLPPLEMGPMSDRKYCLISNDAFCKGKHHLATKVLNVNDKCRIEAWIGIISIRESKWIEQGIETHWPNAVDSVFFNGGWNYNETMEIKMDISTGYVSFWKNKQLIQEGKISNRTQWYFMITGALETIKRIECEVQSV